MWKRFNASNNCKGGGERQITLLDDCINPRNIYKKKPCCRSTNALGTKNGGPWPPTFKHTLWTAKKYHTTQEIPPQSPLNPQGNEGAPFFCATVFVLVHQKTAALFWFSATAPNLQPNTQPLPHPHPSSTYIPHTISSLSLSDQLSPHHTWLVCFLLQAEPIIHHLFATHHHTERRKHNEHNSIHSVFSFKQSSQHFILV